MSENPFDERSLGSAISLDVGRPGETDSSALGAGIYWQSGDATGLEPTEGNGWTLTTELDDVGVPDFTTGVTAGGSVLSVLHILPAAAAWSLFNHQVTCKGTVAIDFYAWNGSGYASLTATVGFGPPNLAYANKAFGSEITAPLSAIAFMYVATQSDGTGGNLRVSGSAGMVA